jgi:flavin-binding protein dodecin
MVPRGGGLGGELRGGDDGTALKRRPRAAPGGSPEVGSRRLAGAVRQAVAEATKTLRGITSVYVQEFQATVENDQVKNFRVNVKVSFVLEEGR